MSIGNDGMATQAAMLRQRADWNRDYAEHLRSLDGQIEDAQVALEIGEVLVDLTELARSGIRTAYDIATDSTNSITEGRLNAIIDSNQSKLEKHARIADLRAEELDERAATAEEQVLEYAQSDAVAANDAEPHPRLAA